MEQTLRTHLTSVNKGAITMGTRSTIAVELDNGQIQTVYCHWDGYLSHNGSILLEHYNSQQLATELVKLGDISVLGKYIEPKTEKHSFSCPETDCTVYYGRDCGVDDVATKQYHDFNDYQQNCYFQEYNYIWRGEWFVDCDDEDKFRKLSEAIDSDKNS
jgi:hypothetical protein